MSRSTLLLIILSVLILGIFTVTSKEYRTAATETALARPRVASSTAPAAAIDATPAIFFQQSTQEPLPAR